MNITKYQTHQKLCNSLITVIECTAKSQLIHYTETNTMCLHRIVYSTSVQRRATLVRQIIGDSLNFTLQIVTMPCVINRNLRSLVISPYSGTYSKTFQ